MARRKSVFDLNTFLTTPGEGRKMLSLQKGETIFAQGDPSGEVFIIQTGLVVLSARVRGSREAIRQAIIDILGERDLFGEGSIAGESLHASSARALTDCQLLRIEKSAMEQALAQEVTVANAFSASLLERIGRYQRDMIDQRCNFSEKKLARVLMRISEIDKQSSPTTRTARIRHQVLADMVGTTRSRIAFIMKRFETSGFIEYDARIQQPRVNESLRRFYTH